MFFLKLAIVVHLDRHSLLYLWPFKSYPPFPPPPPQICVLSIAACALMDDLCYAIACDDFCYAITYSAFRRSRRSFATFYSRYYVHISAILLDYSETDGRKDGWEGWRQTIKLLAIGKGSKLPTRTELCRCRPSDWTLKILISRWTTLENKPLLKRMILWKAFFSWYKPKVNCLANESKPSNSLWSG